MAPNERLAALSAAGVSIWLDDLSRERLTSGNLQELITDYARRRGHDQPDDLRGGAGERRGLRRAGPRAGRPRRVESTTPSARSPSPTSARPATCSAAPGRPRGGVDGRVSLEVSPLLAHDTDATLAEALDLWKAVDRPNLLVKIPATQEGLSAITSALAEGVSVNVTLIFSVERYRDVMNAYLDGPGAGRGERADPRRHRLGGQLLRLPRRHRDRQAAGEDRHRRGAGAARQGRHRELPAGLRRVRGGLPGHAVGAATAQGAKPQRPLWASTGVKNPDYSDTMYVDRAGRRRHRQHDAGEDPAGVRRPRRGPGRQGHRHRRAGAGGVRRPRARRHRPRPTSSSRWRTRASRSSRSRGTSCSTPSRASSTARSEHDLRRTRRIGRVPATRGHPVPPPVSFLQGVTGSVRPVTITEPGRRARRD